MIECALCGGVWKLYMRLLRVMMGTCDGDRPVVVLGGPITMSVRLWDGISSDIK